MNIKNRIICGKDSVTWNCNVLLGAAVKKQRSRANTVCGKYKLRHAAKSDFPNGVLDRVTFANGTDVYSHPAERAAWNCTRIGINLSARRRVKLLSLWAIAEINWTFSSTLERRKLYLCPAAHGIMF